ncbi:MAG: helix-turn-helix domain-containing protein [Cyanobium sp.]
MDPSPLISLGGRLESARKQQGISQEALASRLRLGISQLDALERGDATRLPEVVFVIAQARRVAATLGIAIDAELAALRSSSSVDLPSSKVAAAIDWGEARPRQRSPLTVALPVLMALLLAGLGAVALLRRPWAATTPSAMVPAPPPPAQPPSATGKGGHSAEADAEDMLVLSSQPASWISVRDRNGLQMFEGMVEGEKRFPLGQGLEVLAGRPDLVQVSSGSAEPRPLGSITDVKWRRFGSADPAP